MKKRDRLLLFYLIRDKINGIFDIINDSTESLDLAKYYLEIVRYLQLADIFHLDINNLIDPEEYLSIKKFLLIRGYDIDD